MRVDVRPYPSAPIAWCVVTCLVVAGIVGPARAVEPPCEGGVFVVEEAASPLVPGGNPTVRDAVVIGADGQISIASGCPPVEGKVKGKKRFTKIRGKWASCGDVRKGKLTGKISTTFECDQLFGKFKAKKVKRVKFTALRAGCGDAILTPAAGEECDDGPANSDTEPDACREDCMLPRCGDGVVDAGEACDGGLLQPAGECTPEIPCPDDCQPLTPPGSTTTTTLPGPSFAGEVYPILVSAGCDAPGCHTAPTPLRGLLFDDAANSWATLVGPTGTVISPDCECVPRVVPGDPDMGILMWKLQCQELCPGPVCTPADGHRFAITPQQFETIRQWILSGAPNS